ncbi:MAG: class I mannose-6-phosphate isomerase, partial [Chloroflexi bacterium]
MSSSTSYQGALVLEPQYRDYVWGGKRLRPGQVTAEAWVVYEGDRITNDPLAGKTLGEAADQFGPALLGQRVFQRTGSRFPLLVKLLDCAQWLSLQVHPNDEQAVRLEGPGHFGKTEAWHILEADTGAEILCGFKTEAEQTNWQQAVRDGTILDYTQRVPIHTGETVFIHPGTMHALGPGLLVYEVQQTSDITYRVFDWNRPASAGRKLHI